MSDRKPRLLDLFSGAGGAAKGYQEVGFCVVGVDITKQPNYCGDEFLLGDAIVVLSQMADGVYGPGYLPETFDLIHASPPCQAYSYAQRLYGNDHPDLIGNTRELLQASGLPYVIENVPGAPLISPIELCGAMFGLGTYRHRLFECHGFSIWPPMHPEHDKPTTKMGRPPKPDEMMHVVGNFSDVEQAREAMGIDWMTRDEIREAIPPVYTKWVGEQFLTERPMSERKILKIVCTNCGEPWETGHAEVCELRDGVWLEAEAVLRGDTR